MPIFLLILEYTIVFAVNTNKKFLASVDNPNFLSNNP